jgi:DNA-binding SARP family transcriptional activator
VAGVLPGEVNVRRLSADLSVAGLSPRWISLMPYDLDGAAVDALITVMNAGARDDRRLVIEARDRGLARHFLSRLEHGDARGSPAGVVVLHHLVVPRHADRQRTARRTPGTVPWQADLQRLTGGRPALHDSVLATGQRLHLAEFAAIIERSRNVDELTTRLARSLLQNVVPAAMARLGLVALLRYHHPRFASVASVLDACGTLPWWIELSGGWRRLDPAWRRSVLTVCGEHQRPPVAPLGRLAGELIEDGATGSAIELCLDAGYPGTAGDLLAGLGPHLLAAGWTLAVRRWLGRLPWTERLRHRTLAAEARARQRELRSRGLRAPAAARTRRPVLSGSGIALPARQPACLPLSPAANPQPSPLANPPLTPLANPLPSPPARAPEPDRGDPADLAVRVLGPLEVRVGGREIERWRGRKGNLLLAYLLLRRHGPPIASDALASAFWPDATPEVSRNRLHVTMHTLRADLRMASPIAVVEFDRGYRVNPELSVRLDTEQFQIAAARGAEAEAAGDAEAALHAYGAASDRYRGDLLGDHPFEDWTLLPREHYRVRHLELLGRMAQLAFDTGRYVQALEIGHRLLALDFCREDLHRLLMRTHTRMGRPQAAVHQFEMCTVQLRRELGMAPDDETVALYERIRSRSPV